MEPPQRPPSPTDISPSSPLRQSQRRVARRNVSAPHQRLQKLGEAQQDLQDYVKKQRSKREEPKPEDIITDAHRLPEVQTPVRKGTQTPLRSHHVGKSEESNVPLIKLEDYFAKWNTLRILGKKVENKEINKQERKVAKQQLQTLNLEFESIDIVSLVKSPHFAEQLSDLKGGDNDTEKAFAQFLITKIPFTLRFVVATALFEREVSFNKNPTELFRNTMTIAGAFIGEVQNRLLQPFLKDALNPDNKYSRDERFVKLIAGLKRALEIEPTFKQFYSSLLSTVEKKYPGIGSEQVLSFIFLNYINPKVYLLDKESSIVYNSIVLKSDPKNIQLPKGYIEDRHSKLQEIVALLKVK